MQWDPDHDPSGAKCERRAIQLGLKGHILTQYAHGSVIAKIEDISDFVHEQHAHVQAKHYHLLRTPHERVYPAADDAVASRLQLDVYEGVDYLPYETDGSRFPLDPKIRKLEDKLVDTGRKWWVNRSKDEGKANQLLTEFYARMAELYDLGWDNTLDIQDELPDLLMPEEYLRRNRRPKPKPKALSSKKKHISNQHEKRFVYFYSFSPSG